MLASRPTLHDETGSACMGNESAAINASMIDFDAALSICDREFLIRHPREGWPEGISGCLTKGGTLDQSGRWLMSYSAAYKEPIREGEWWADIRGRRVLCKTNPVTGQPQVVLSRRASLPPLVVFEIAIDARSKVIEVLRDTDLATFDCSLFERVD